jgi:outer membrane PBP1 activator LpoA protein
VGFVSLLLFLAATYLAIRSLVSLVLQRRDQLSQLLVEHVKNSRAEQKKKLQILAFRKKMREKKAEEAARAHPDENDTSSKAA